MNTIRQFAIAMTVMLLCACGAGTAPQSTPQTTPAAPTPQTDAAPTPIDQYEQRAVALSQGIGAAQADPATRAMAVQLIELAAAITPQFVQRHPSCGAYLNAALGVRDKLTELDAETIERDYHDDAALPVEGTAPACYHMKDLIVHPATALLLLEQSQPDFTAAKREIDEVIAHIGVVRASL